MVGVKRISEKRISYSYSWKTKDFRINLNCYLLFKEHDILNALGALMSYFGDDPSFFDNAFKNIHEECLVRFFHSSGIGAMKNQSEMKRVKTNWDAFRNKWMVSDDLWLNESEFVKVTSDVLLNGSFAVIPLERTLYEDSILAGLENGIFNLTLNEGYKAYSLHARTHGACIAGEKVIESYDEISKLKLASSSALAVIVISDRKNDEDLFNWASSYSKLVEAKNYLRSSDLICAYSEMDSKEMLERLREDIVAYINKPGLLGIDNEFTVRNLGEHGDLLTYERRCRDAYFSCLQECKSEVQEKWGNRFTPYSKELADAVRQSSHSLPIWVQFVDELQQDISAAKIKSKVKIKPTDKLSKRGTILGIQ